VALGHEGFDNDADAPSAETALVTNMTEPGALVTPPASNQVRRICSMASSNVHYHLSSTQTCSKVLQDLPNKGLPRGKLNMDPWTAS
jgi:hypothetical protein